MFDIKRTNAVAKPMASAFSAVLETARTGHMPNTCTNTGLSFHTPLMNSSVDGLFINEAKNPALWFVGLEGGHSLYGNGAFGCYCCRVDH